MTREGGQDLFEEESYGLMKLDQLVKKLGWLADNDARMGFQHDAEGNCLVTVAVKTREGWHVETGLSLAMVVTTLQSRLQALAMPDVGKNARVDDPLAIPAATNDPTMREALLESLKEDAAERRQRKPNASASIEE